MSGYITNYRTLDSLDADTWQITEYRTQGEDKNRTRTYHRLHVQVTLENYNTRHITEYACTEHKINYLTQNTGPIEANGLRIDYTVQDTGDYCIWDTTELTDYMIHFMIGTSVDRKIGWGCITTHRGAVITCFWTSERFLKF
jgi:hypothetical protein